MKILYLSIIVLLVVVFNANIAYAEQPLLDFYNNSQLVLVGKVISLSQVPTTTSNPSQSPNQTKYDIQVEEYYKNPQSAKLITVYGFAKGIYYSSDPTYDVGDRVFLYINKENGYYQIQPHSLRLHNNCNARPLIPMPSLPFESPIISMPAFDRLFTFSDSRGNEKSTFALGEDVNIKFNAENYFPVVKYAGIELSMMTENNTKLVFTDKKENIIIPACNGNVPVSWSFRPETPGHYSALVNATGGLDFGRTEVFYSEPSIGSGFDVRQNTSSVVVEKGPYVSPLKQFKSGIAAQDVKCKEGLELVMKSENNSPACVKLGTADNLIKRGWAQPTIIPSKKVHEILPLIPSNTVKSSVNPDNQTSSTLKLFISTDSTYTSPGNPIGVDISLNNTSSTPLILTKSDNWPRNDLSSGPCSNLPFGMAILRGYYTEQNMSNANSLVIFQNIPCPLPAKIKSYTFQPLSSKATQECDSLFSCTGLVDMKTHLEISGFVDNNSPHHPFSIGTYTIIVGDQWGHVAIQHFSEAYTTPLADLKGN